MKVRIEVLVDAATAKAVAPPAPLFVQARGPQAVVVAEAAGPREGLAMFDPWLAALGQASKA
ncbi:MAG TPA: hypothetical protein VGR28_04295 [Candidatus Thermoplasmatota archaeon]|jgi:hypothetical protein|nr:hypothetical protein [Candidatus Thermoplasmatota archaeon]